MINKEMNRLSDLFIRVVNRYNEVEKIPFSYGTDTLLYPSDVHTIEVIGNNANINITRLAKLQGITKGAISKRIQQLVKKGFVNKSASPRTENEVVLNLTEKGERVFKGHQEYSNEFNLSLSKLYNSIPIETINELETIAYETEKLFMKISKERKELLTK